MDFRYYTIEFFLNRKNIIKRLENNDVVCAPQTIKGLFTTGQVANIDLYHSFVTAANSLSQYPTEDNQRTDRDPKVSAKPEWDKRIPLVYTNSFIHADEYEGASD